MRIAVILLLNLLAQHVSANDLLWQKLRTEADLVVLMRHTQPAGGYDEPGQRQVRPVGTHARPGLGPAAMRGSFPSTREWQAVNLCSTSLPIIGSG